MKGGQGVRTSLLEIITKIKGFLAKIVSEYDQEIPQSQTADKPMAPRVTQLYETPGRQTRRSIQLSFPHQDDCKTRMDIM